MVFVLCYLNNNLYVFQFLIMVHLRNIKSNNPISYYRIRDTFSLPNNKVSHGENFDRLKQKIMILCLKIFIKKINLQIIKAKEKFNKRL